MLLVETEHATDREIREFGEQGAALGCVNRCAGERLTGAAEQLLTHVRNGTAMRIEKMAQAGSRNDSSGKNQRSVPVKVELRLRSLEGIREIPVS